MEAIMDNLTKAEILEELVKKGFTQSYLNNKNKAELAALLANSEAKAAAAKPAVKRIPKCEVF